MARDLVPFLVMVLTQVCYAGMNITSKLAMESGMNPLVLVAYRQIFATLAISPFGYLMERKTRPKITLPILFQIFLCSMTGAVANQVFYFIGLKNSTATISCALTNILPAVTFVLAVLFRQETAEIMKKPGLAKIVGTIICVGGAMLLSFYHGHTIGLGGSNIHWTYIDTLRDSNSSTKSNFILGPLFLILSTVGWALWFIIQARLSEKFPAPYTSTALMCFMASIECGAIGLLVEHNISGWSLQNPMWLVASLFAGILGSALAFFLTSWSIQRKGPLYASVFSPLLLIIVAILSWALLRETLYVGTAVGSICIVVGLYAVLWGKNREMKQGHANEDEMSIAAEDDDDQKRDLELQSYDVLHHSNVNYQVSREDKQAQFQ
ncbi:hypothetical protein FNV43_RR04349 [Rhamnella rubrinervis]|uniref:WAT1-related protein n=1 Tax=Rhamnella rubrinervis TaxID=2594499 RepID=A0A8K0MQ59_9ROSA|nr:hypothetical protein FNV43_RR04349 [Rhamnella rubrinervis]